MTLIRSCEVRAVRHCGEVTGFYRACDRCRNQILHWLGDIERDFARLNPQPLPTAIGQGGGGAFGSKSPARDHVITMMDPRSSPVAIHQDDRDNAPRSVPAVVEGWCQVAWRKGEDAWPGTLGAGIAYLRVKVDWFSRQDCAAAFAEEIRTVHGQLRASSEPVRKIGECPTVVAEFRGQVVRCEAPLRRALDDDAIRCAGCGTVWAHPWRELRSELSGTTLLAYRDLAIWFKVPVGTLYRWRSEDGWEQMGGTERRPLWSLIDVWDSYDKRRTDKPSVEAS